MRSAAFDPTFSVPFRHLWSTNFTGDQSATPARPSGLARFVGDQPNELLKYLISDTLVCSDDSDHEFATIQTNSRFQWPLVLFGPSGTGKTSLALTIVSDLSDRLNATATSKQNLSDSTHNPVKPMFMTALDFDRRYRSALETDSILDFRNRLIYSGGLVIDDLHRLVDKPAAQTEFLLILDKMCGKNRPFVVTMNVSPQLSKGLSAQLVSRLSGGLTLPVHPPGPSARLEIIRDLANINRINLTSDAAQLLVSRLNVTVPKLDHFLAQIKTTLRSQPDENSPTIDAAKLTRLFKKSDVDLDRMSKLITKMVAAEFHMKQSDLKSNSRKQSIVMARGVAIYLSRVLLGLSFLKIGTYFGNRDHSTILHAYRKIDKLIADSLSNQDAAAIPSAVEKLKQQLAEQFASQINFV